MSESKAHQVKLKLPVRQKTSAPAKNRPPAVTIDSDYPPEEVMIVIKKLRVPKLKKITDSLF